MYVASILFFSREVSELAGKHRKEKIEHALTKRQLSRWEKQKKQSRIIVICVAAMVVAVVGLICGGYYWEQVMPNQKAVIKVNDASFDYDYYTKILDIITKSVTKEQISYYADIAAQAVAQGELVRQKAADFSLSATDEEIKQELENGSLTENNVGLDLARTRVLTKKYSEQVCVPKQPKSVQHVEVEAMFLESKAMVNDRKQKLIAGENFTKMASEFSMEPYSKSVKGYLGWIPKGYEDYALGDLQGAAFKDVIFTLQPKTFSDAIFDSSIEKAYGFWVLQLLEKDDAKGYHGRGILLPTQEQAEDIRARLLSGGNWDDLAKQYSQAAGKDSGADLGWILPGSDTKTMLVRILAAQQPNQISDVIRDETAKTSGGYWLVQVMNVQDRPLNTKLSQYLSQECLNEWIMGLVKDAKIENLLDQKQKDLAVQKISKTRSK
jgi:parvulin-like peptidyl-prolyl isomerase